MPRQNLRPHRSVLKKAETGVPAKSVRAPLGPLPALILYHDITPKQIWLGHADTLRQQQTICELREGMPLHLVPDRYGTGWEVQTAAGRGIGALARPTNSALARKGVRPGRLQFRPGEVSVRSIYRHLEVHAVTGAVQQDVHCQ